MDVDREWFDKDYYATLGVAKDASAKDITSAYRKLARQLHPDANPGDTAAEERFKEVSAAYEVVGDPDKRSRYDEVRAMGPMAGGFAPGGGPGPGGGFDGVDLGDLLGGMFSRNRSTRRPQGPQRGQDLEAALTMPFESAIAGATTTVQVTSDVRCPDCSGSGAAPGTSPRPCGVCDGRGAVDEDQGFFSFSRPCQACGGRGSVIETPCPTCAGAGAVHRPREIKVRIPRGVRDGQRIRVKGRGAAGLNGGPDGDLFVRVHVQPHATFGRKGDHLSITVPITMAEAALGADVSVPTLEGDPVTIRVPAGTQSAKTFRVRDRGVKTSKSTGDLLVTVEVDVPAQLNDAQREALEALALATPSPRATTEPAR
ncbi:MAG: molecular chaperone DnaJ [Actinomycetia bacterium]|nr:molecular chaperone DnaJ [Actinomycetes bacterium]